MQSDGLVAQFGSGRLTRKAVFCEKSKTVKRSLGNGEPAGDARSNNGCTSAAAATAARSSAAMIARRADVCLGRKCLVQENRFVVIQPPGDEVRNHETIVSA